jgi:hypothetical protein
MSRKGARPFSLSPLSRGEREKKRGAEGWFDSAARFVAERNGR